MKLHIQFAYILKACILKKMEVMDVTICFYKSLVSCTLNKINSI